MTPRDYGKWTNIIYDWGHGNEAEEWRPGWIKVTEIDTDGPKMVRVYYEEDTLLIVKAEEWGEGWYWENQIDDVERFNETIVELGWEMS